MTAKEAAEYIGVSLSTVYELCEARRLGHSKVGLGRRKIVIPKEDADAYLASCRVDPVDPAEPSPAPARKQVRKRVIPDYVPDRRRRT